MAAIVFGVVSIFDLTDWTRQAKWLADDEREWITGELEKEKRAKEEARHYSMWQALRNREVLLLTLAYFFIVTSQYGFNVWIPTIVKSMSGASNFAVTIIAALPYSAALIALLVVGWSSDRTQERRWHTAGSMLLAGRGVFLSGFPHGQLPPRVG